MSVPVVDFSAYNLNKKDVSDEQLQLLSKELKTAFTETGFVYLKNTGIIQEEVDCVLDISTKFFLQPEEQKQPFTRQSIPSSPHHGWMCLANEKLNPLRPGDLKELFNISTLRTDIDWPSSGNLKGFQEIHTSFFLRCKELSLRVLRVIALSLGVDPVMFLNAHRLMGGEGNGTMLRALYYPPVNIEKVKEGQLRCGEHSDYGSITLVFQGRDEGLEVLNRSGDYVAVPTIPGTVLINICELIQRWTNDQYIAGVHRVLLPSAGDCGTRESLVFFAQPDADVVVTCFDGSLRYPPVRAGDYIMARFNSTAV